jgi:hypothetical protein
VLIGRSALAPDKPTARYKDRLALAGQVRRRIPDPFNLPLESSDISAWSGRIAQLRRFNLFREGPRASNAVQHRATARIFALRSLVPRNLIASSIVELVAIERAILQVCGLDCLRRHTAYRFEAGARSSRRIAGKSYSDDQFRWVAATNTGVAR